MQQETSTEDNTDITKMKVPELRRELKIRGLKTQGNKTELMERLQEVLKTKTEETASATSVDDLEEDLLNGDDDEHLDETTSCIDIDNLENISAQKGQKRKSEETKADKTKVAKKIVLKRNSSHTEESITSTNLSNNQLPGDKKIVKLSELGMKERLEMRAKKFGVALSGEAQKAARAARFGVSPTNGKLSTDGTKTSVDVLKKRAERFGTSVSSLMTNIETQEKLEKRKQRFGLSTNGSVKKAN